MPPATLQQQDYKTESGPLAQTYQLFVPGTHNTGAQISIARALNPDNAELQQSAFYVSNVPLATKRDGKLLLGISLTPDAFDVVFGGSKEDTRAACSELINSGYVTLSDQKKASVLQLEQRGLVAFVDPAGLELSGSADEYRSFQIRTSKHEKDVKGAREYWAQAAFGVGVMREMVMKYLMNNRFNDIAETTGYTMNPEHAAEHLADDKIIARAAWLHGVDGDSGFVALGCGVDNRAALRGEPQPKVAEGDAPITPLETLVGRGAIGRRYGYRSSYA